MALGGEEGLEQAECFGVFAAEFEGLGDHAGFVGEVFVVDGGGAVLVEAGGGVAVGGDEDVPEVGFEKVVEEGFGDLVGHAAVKSLGPEPDDEEQLGVVAEGCQGGQVGCIEEFDIGDVEADGMGLVGGKLHRVVDGVLVFEVRQLPPAVGVDVSTGRQETGVGLVVGRGLKQDRAVVGELERAIGGDGQVEVGDFGSG